MHCLQKTGFNDTHCLKVKGRKKVTLYSVVKTSHFSAKISKKAGVPTCHFYLIYY